MKKILAKIHTALKIPLGWVLYTVSFLIPRNEKIWVFIGWRKSKTREIFAENPKYVYLYTAHHEKTVRPIWIGADESICKILNDRGYEAYPIHSWRGIWYSLRAGYTFLGGLMQPVNWQWSGNSRIIQLWHSKSLKKTGYNSPYGLGRYRQFMNPGLFVNYFRFVAMSDYLAQFAAQDFHLKPEQFLISGLPKHDPLVTTVSGGDIDEDTLLLETITRARSINPRKVILYGPTFRPDGSNPLAGMHFTQMNKFLEDNNLAMIVTLHPKFSTKDWAPGNTLSNIFFCQSDHDIYPIMSHLDLLITDYSSLTMDFLYMDKPVVLYAPDLETFKEGMGVYDELWSLMPGPKALTFEELMNILKDAVDQPSEMRKLARETLFAFSDGNASKRIVDMILSQTSSK